MGMALSFKLFIRHLFTNPVDALSGFLRGIPDIIQQMYFYITELSLTGCFVILIVLAARLLLSKTPKNKFYGLWCISFVKLVVPLVIPMTDISFVPYTEIENVYNSVATEHTFLYDTEAGFVNIIQSENILPPSISPVKEFYTPAFIWFAVFFAIVAFTLIRHINIKCKVNSTKVNLRDNIYICENISTPFVMGIFRPKIYLPAGLSQQDQEYVITHEKAHIKHYDHINKLCAYYISCLHWFNPLVWISFLLYEKDMEIACDERVLDKLGYEHKKDYSRCILSLATGRQFVPKANLYFGDSDTKKRIKNVLKYKKATAAVSVFTAVVLAVTFVGILSDDGTTAPPHNPATEFVKMEENFPDGSDNFSLTLAGMQTNVSFKLPHQWTIEKRNIQIGAEPEYLTIDDNFSDVWDIYNNDGEFVGAMGFLNYTEYLGSETNLMAIYGPVALGNMYSFDLSEENYFAVEKDENGLWEKATTKVYHSPSLVHNNGGLGNSVYGDGILAYNRECLAFVAFEFSENYFSEKELRYIAASVNIRPQNSFESVAAAVLSMTYRNMKTGTDFDISEYVSEDVLELLKAKEEIAKHRIRVFGTSIDSYNVQVIPYERESWIVAGNNADIRLQVLQTYRYNTANFDSSQSEVIRLKLAHDERGKIVITDYRIDGKDINFADMDNDYWAAVEKGNGKQFLNEFVKEYKGFISNSSSSVELKNQSEYQNKTFQINFPVYDQQTEYNKDIFDKSFAFLIRLPNNWSVDVPKTEDTAFPLVGAWNRMGIYDENKNMIGAVGYNIYDNSLSEPMAIYNQIALGNHYQFAVGGNDYADISNVTSVTKVYTSANMAKQLNLGTEEIVNHGILCRNSKYGVYVAIEFDKNLSNDDINNIAHSVFIGEAVVDNPYSDESIEAAKQEIAEFVKNKKHIDILAGFVQTYGFTIENIRELYKNEHWQLVTNHLHNGDSEHIKTVLQMFIDGKTDVEIREFARKELYNTGMTKDVLRSFTHHSFSIIEVYCMTEETINNYWEEWNTIAPRWLTYENLAAEIADKYKKGKIEYSFDFGRLPDDFVFPESILSDANSIFQNELGYYVVPIYSAVGDNVMYVAIDDSEYLSAEIKNYDIEPIVKSVSFKKPYIKEWNLSVGCAKESTENKYIITYCDKEITAESGTLYLTNKNDFDITVHLLSTGNKEITADILSGHTVEISVKVNTDYTVGIHADVAENTEINLKVFETY